MESKKKLVDAQDAVKLLRGKCVAKYPNTFLQGLLAAASEIEGMPEAELVVHGEWEQAIWGEKVPGLDNRCWRCSACGKRQSYGESDYCPNCGAKMDLGER